MARIPAERATQPEINNRPHAVTRRTLRVAVIYHIWPHYRMAVAEALDRSARIQYSFYASGEPYQGIVHGDMTQVRRFIRAPFRQRGKMLWQPEAVKAASAGYDAIIYLGDPNFASTWTGAALARLRGVPVLFWAHGWRRAEAGAKRRMRNLFFGLAQRILVYNERAKRLGAEAGYPDERITVIYNSLDVARADDIVSRIEAGTLKDVRPQSLFAEPARPLLICTARLTNLCRFDLLLEAAERLKAAGRPVNVLLVGDGPERASLEADAVRRGLSVHFYGACYDEAVIGQLIYHADLTVSPGKIGLTAMHSLMYGTPAITHDDLNEQMPEVEAIEPGRTGLLFRHDDAGSLTDAIAGWLDSSPDRAAVREAARRVIHSKWNPETQALLIEQAVLEVTGG
ncbi:glycosyltransferase [Sphingomonas jatrophae]|uniref:Glycosyltransferase involved in cell wall bisynthesis n=1 Tax=Sphingomonas jatrophae TaxID=1166337 RepID=A0A1I6M5C7_9SPHN|nr:glycosyltransferase [Sphingomonas jatrophae]SFS10900.1 Glycosyltransferase involved in cell wall bisynthesis [Sphingomonas jatrophae]